MKGEREKCKQGKCNISQTIEAKKIQLDRGKHFLEELEKERPKIKVLRKSNKKY